MVNRRLSKPYEDRHEIIEDGGEEPRTDEIHTGDLVECEPQIHEDFPIDDGSQLSPPFIRPPLYQCAEAVFVSGFIPCATVRVFADEDLVGETTPMYGFVHVPLNRPLEEGEKVTATQEVDEFVSDESPSVPVELYEGPLSPLRITQDCYDCGRVVSVDNVVPGARIDVLENGTKIGEEHASRIFAAVLLERGMTEGREIRARQVMCANGPGEEVEGPLSEPEKVQPEPNPVTAPILGEPRVGNDAIPIRNLYPGASVDIFDRGTDVNPGFWWASDTAHHFPVYPPIEAGSEYTAEQELCEPSSPSDPVPATDEHLDPPTVLGPICRGSSHVRLRDTVINATVVLLVNGHIAGFGGAGVGELILTLGGGQTLETGDSVTARQYIRSDVSDPSEPVPVGSGLSDLSVEVDGMTSFRDSSGEGYLGFSRERTSGVTIRAMTCCEEGTRAVIFGPSGREVANIELHSVFPGYQEGRWQWITDEEFDPTDIAVGQYRVRVETQCDQDPSEQVFWVVITEPNYDDPTPPSVLMEVRINGEPYVLTDRDRESIEVSVEANSYDVEITTVVEDNDGVKDVFVMPGSHTSVVEPTEKRTEIGDPIFTKVSMTSIGTNIPSGPYGSPFVEYINARGVNWNRDPIDSRSDTPSLIISAESPPPLPTVSLTADPSSISEGGSTDLRWTSSDAEHLEIDRGIGSVSVPSGSQTVTPPESRIYRITAYGPGGSRSDSASVNVRSRMRTGSADMPLHYLGRRRWEITQRDGTIRYIDFDVYQQTRPENYTDLGVLRDNARVTNVVNRTEYTGVVGYVYPDDGRWLTSDRVLEPDHSTSTFNGRPFYGTWQLAILPVLSPLPEIRSLEVSWSVSI